MHAEKFCKSGPSTMHAEKFCKAASAQADEHISPSMMNCIWLLQVRILRQAGAMVFVADWTMRLIACSIFATDLLLSVLARMAAGAQLHNSVSAWCPFLSRAWRVSVNDGCQPQGLEDPFLVGHW